MMLASLLMMTMRLMASMLCSASPVVGVAAAMVDDWEHPLQLFLVDCYHYFLIDEVLLPVDHVFFSLVVMMMTCLHSTHIDHHQFFSHTLTAYTTIQVSEHNRWVLPTIPWRFHSKIVLLPFQPKIDRISKIPTAPLLQDHICPCPFYLAISKGVQRAPHFWMSFSHWFALTLLGLVQVMSPPPDSHISQLQNLMPCWRNQCLL